MERLTQRDEYGNADIIALSDVMPEIYAGLSFSETNALTDALNRLAAYEDTGLEPDDIAIIKNIIGRLATADYPHNFQREREDIVAYMYWITSILKDAKEWWNGMVTRNKEGDR